MITGTIYNTGKMLEMTQKWKQKKSSSNILKKEVKELSPEEQQLKMYQEQLEREREGNEYSSIYAKIQSGQELSPAEEDKLRAKDPKMYMEYKADRMEQEAYEKKLKNCKTKEEAERLLKEITAIDELGAYECVLEHIPEILGEKLTKAVSLITIGIGGGPHTDGHVTVLHDALGINNGKIPPFATKYCNIFDIAKKGIEDYVSFVLE